MAVSGLLRSSGAALRLLAQVVSTVRERGLAWPTVLRHATELGASSAPLVSMGLLFFGAVMVTIAQAQARRYTGNVTVVGAAYFELIVREFAPMLVALLAATRAGAAVSAELASMAVNEQLDALRLNVADPIRELVAPRLVASLITMPLLMILGTAASSLSAMAVVTYAFGADGSAFVDPRFLDGGDIACAALKAMLTGLAIPLTTAVQGLRASGGAHAVGEAVTQGVIDACTACLLLDFGVAAIFLSLGW